MLYPELTLFAQRYALPPVALEELHVLVSSAVAASTEQLRHELRADSRDQALDLAGTLADSGGVALQTLARTHIEYPRSLFMGSDGATFGGDRVSLRVEGDVAESEHGELLGGHDSRYEDLGLLGEGGMGEVRRVRERDLNRTLAMKIIKPDVMESPAQVARFIEEAQVSAQLQHPSIIPVHDIGRMPDGRLYFTMQEVRGRELEEAISSVHAASRDDQWAYDAEGWSLRQLVGALHQVCLAVGYAHARGVVHRDLKPSNIMVGHDGEVFVVDWGVAKIRGRKALHSNDVAVDSEPLIETHRSADVAQATRAGAVTGTPAYMPPEQAEGRLNDISARSDVYALGVILYRVLTGRVPYEETRVWQLLMAVIKGDFQTPSAVTTKKLPADLEDICVRALSAKPADRYANARDMADELGAWLDGVKRRERALELVHSANQSTLEGTAMVARAEVLRDEGKVFLDKIPRWAPEKDKFEGWSLEDEASALEQAANLRSLASTQALHAALTHVPDLPEAHQMLAAHYQRQHQRAEAAREQRRAKRNEVLLGVHAHALPRGDAKQGFEAYLKGTGALTLLTEPMGAEVHLYRFVTRRRRLVPELVRSLGRTPLIRVPLEMGSYLLELHKEGHEVVRYPVLIERNQHWDGVRPGDREAQQILLPPSGSLGPTACYVPAGWFWTGGDSDAYDGWPRRRYWADAFVMQKFPVTNREYLAFLDDLVKQGREDEALLYVPRERSGTASERGAMIYGQDAHGRFILVPDADGDTWSAGWPVMMIDWFGARAYAHWSSLQDGKAWRLSTELEWEKSARGVDGRFFPWGDYLDPSWCWMRESHRTQPLPNVVESCPRDISVYGVRGLAGNMREWCENVYSAEAPTSSLVDVHVSDPQEVSLVVNRTTRGGAWLNPAIYCRANSRLRFVPSSRGAYLGVRLTRSYRPAPSHTRGDDAEG